MEEEKRIAIFDDDQDTLELCSIILTKIGYIPVAFNNCNDIVEKVKDSSPALIIMDNWIPKSGGIVATQTLKKYEGIKNIPVVFFSANHKIGELAKEAGADSYIAKPFDIVEMERIIKKLIR